jgi:hypothetical protein
LQSRCMRISNQPIPMYDRRRIQHQSNHLKQAIDRMRRISKTVIRGRYGTQCVEFMPCSEQSATVVSLTSLMECVLSNRAITPGRKYCLQMPLVPVIWHMR